MVPPLHLQQVQQNENTEWGDLDQKNIDAWIDESHQDDSSTEVSAGAWMDQSGVWRYPNGGQHSQTVRSPGGPPIPEYYDMSQSVGAADLHPAKIQAICVDGQPTCVEDAWFTQE